MTLPELGGVIVAAVVGGLAAFSVGRWWRRRVSRRTPEESDSKTVVAANLSIF